MMFKIINLDLSKQLKFYNKHILHRIATLESSYYDDYVYKAVSLFMSTKEWEEMGNFENF